MIDDLTDLRAAVEAAVPRENGNHVGRMLYLSLSIYIYIYIYVYIYIYI